MTTFHERIRKTLKIDPQATAIEFRGEWMSWGELGRIVEGVDAALAQAGLPADGGAGLVMRNTPPICGAVLSLIASDRCLITLNPYYPDATLAEDVRKLRPAAVVASKMDWERPAFREAAREIGAAGIEIAEDGAVRLVPGLEAIGPGEHFQPEEDVGIYMLTSGTTGPPKRIPMTRHRILKTLEGAAQQFEKNRTLEDEPVLRKAVMIHQGSMTHVGGLWNLISAVMGGFRICLLDKFNAAEWRRAIAVHKPRAAGLPPSAVRMLLDTDATKEELSSLVALRCGTAPLDADTIDAVWDRWGLAVLTSYGSTEFTGVAGWQIDDFRKNWKAKRGAAGRLNPIYEARVRDLETDEILPPGKEGVLELRGDHVWNGQWVRTTDRAILDEDKYIWIKGRLDNAINRGGFKVHGEEIASVLNQHPDVREACVVGVPDKRLGEAPAAAVILRDGGRLTEEELRAWAREHMLPYQVPVRFVFVDDLPRTASEKPMLPAVRALLAEAAEA
ncbi:MAG: AMP-binding protein [Caulobacteraceae bacterium]|nr:AMP-binding protein [Caulobacteraceae bacterium]